MNEEKRYKKITNAWCMYDWANSAFATTIMAAVFPPFYRSLVTSTGLAESTATAYWGYTTSIALLLIALTAPVLGAIADYTGEKNDMSLFLSEWECFARRRLSISGLTPGSWPHSCLSAETWGLPGPTFFMNPCCRTSPLRAI